MIYSPQTDKWNVFPKCSSCSNDSEKLWSKPEHAHLLVLSAAPLRVSMSCQVAIVIIPYYTIVGPYQGHISRRSGTRELSRFLRGDNTQIEAVTPVSVW